MKRKIFFIASIIFILDQIVKFTVDIHLLKEIVIVDNFFSLYKVYNTGVAFSFFAGSIYFIILINIIILIFLIKYLKNFKKNLRNTIAFGLTLGGLCGNLIDRILYGHVIDYFKLFYKEYTFPIFNIADIALTTGIVLIIYAVFKKEDEYGINSK